MVQVKIQHYQAPNEINAPALKVMLGSKLAINCGFRPRDIFGFEICGNGLIITYLGAEGGSISRNDKRVRICNNLLVISHNRLPEMKNFNISEPTLVEAKIVDGKMVIDLAPFRRQGFIDLHEVKGTQEDFLPGFRE